MWLRIAGHRLRGRGRRVLAGLDAWRALALAAMGAVSLVAIALFPQQLPAFSKVGTAAVVVWQ